MTPVVLNPTGSSDEAPAALAPRFPDLDGKSIGLLHSSKHNSDRVLDGVAELLEERFQVKRVVRQVKPTFSRPVPADQATDLATQVDVVITGVGD